MHRHIIAAARALAFAVALVSPLGGQETPSTQGAGAPLRYPESRRSDQTDDYHGTLITDPYRWLEDVGSPETKDWVSRQNAVTFGYLASLPEREPLRKRLSEIWNYPKYGVPFKEGGRYFYRENSGLQNQSVLYMRRKLDEPPRTVLDPNKLSADGTVALSTVEISPNGKLLAYGLSRSGSDWQVFRVRDIDSGRDLPDRLDWIKFSSAAWTHDNKGFFYARYDAPAPGADTLTGTNRNQKLYYHRVGTPQSADRLVYARSDQPEWIFGTKVTRDGLYAVINVSQGTDERNRLYFIDLDNPRKPRVFAPVVKLFDRLEAKYEFIGNRGPVFYVRTTKDTPRGRIVAVDTHSPREEDWRPIVSESDDVLVSATIAGDRIVANFLRDAHASLRTFTMSGLANGEIQLPGPGSVTSISGRPFDNELFYGFASYLQPPTIYRMQLPTRRVSEWRRPVLPIDVGPYETRQLFARSRDGTRIPILVTARKDVTLDGNNPTILYAYGGFNISITPSFSPVALAWIERGGIYAVANLRGGGEYGMEWHNAGTLARKQNVFDDFIAAAEHLVAEKYTRPSKLAIQGRSNGGLLVGAAMTQRPELFGVALPAVGVMDMLRFHRFTIGWAWTSDYGSADTPDGFRYLSAYSPLHRLVAGTRYPATLITTADHDDRVVPGHSFKFAAALQVAQAPGGPPTLIRIETKAGHGAGKPTTKQIEEAADILSFTLHNLGVVARAPVPAS